MNNFIKLRTGWVKNTIPFLMVLTLTAFMFSPKTGEAQQAEVQVIHNAADPAADTVDVYLDDDLILEDFGFREATDFINAPADQDILIGIAPQGSNDASDTLAAFSFNLNDGVDYTLVANGVLDPSDFDDSVNDIAFDLFANAPARQEADDPAEVDFNVFHGGTDAPAVDIFERDLGELIEDHSYGEFSPYLSVSPDDYIIDVYPSGSADAVGSFEADLNGLDGRAATIFASGFLDPAANQGGEDFGLWAALDDGSVVELPATGGPETGFAQIIHNAADPAAEEVDLYLEEELLLDGFEFREATDFVELNADRELQLGIAPAGTSIGDTVAAFTLNPGAGNYYSVIANGVLNPADFDDSVNDIGFDLFRNAAQDEAKNEDEVDLNVFHGATDAPAVDIFERDLGELVADHGYGQFSEYLSVDPAEYIIDIYPSGSADALASFEADISNLEGGSATIFASGFLNPEGNQDGEAFGLFAALADGTVIALEQTDEPEEGFVQIIHNAADPAAEEVDIYLEGEVLLEGFAFREATDFVGLNAAREIQLGIAPAGEPLEDAVTFTIDPGAGNYYTAIANGVLNPEDFDQSVNDIAFDLYRAADARPEADIDGNVDIRAFHGATDLPAVDIEEREQGDLISGLGYGEFSEDYIELAEDNYTLDLYRDELDSAFASFEANLEDIGLEGEALTLFASGFAEPQENQDGEALGLFAADTEGNVVALNATETPVSIINVEELDFDIEGPYPNPASEEINLVTSDADLQLNSIEVIDLNGKTLKSVKGQDIRNGNNHYRMDITDLEEGVYLINVKVDGQTFTERMVIH